MLMGTADGAGDRFRALGKRLLETGLIVSQRAKQSVAAGRHDGIDAFMGGAQRLRNLAGAGGERVVDVVGAAGEGRGELVRAALQRGRDVACDTLHGGGKGAGMRGKRGVQFARARGQRR